MSSTREIDSTLDERCRRVRSVLLAARRVADPSDPLGREARRLLPESTGLSPQGVALALRSHLETDATDAEVRALVACTEPAPRVHVVLSANVFVAAARAIALAAAATPIVRVRASRREPVMADLLVRALREQKRPLDVEPVSDVAAAPRDQVHVYGRAESIEAIASSLPSGTRLWAHGPGLGIAVVGEEDDPAITAERLSWDVAVFDQRGCLSPRVVIWSGQGGSASRFAEALARELAAREAEVPRGRLDPTESTEALFYSRTVQMTGRCWSSTTSAVGLHSDASIALLPPPGRHVAIVCSPPEAGVPAWINQMARSITTIGSLREERLFGLLKSSMPSARLAEIGGMQRPPFDGPVDRRATIGDPLQPECFEIESRAGVSRD